MNLSKFSLKQSSERSKFLAFEGTQLNNLGPVTENELSFNERNLAIAACLNGGTRHYKPRLSLTNVILILPLRLGTLPFKILNM